MIRSPESTVTLMTEENAPLPVCYGNKCRRTIITTGRMVKASKDCVNFVTEFSMSLPSLKNKKEKSKYIMGYQ